jgi:hypothetical protein
VRTPAGEPAADDTVTEQIPRRPIGRLPGVLDPAYERERGDTEVLSLDELMEVAAISGSAPVAPPPPPAPPTVAPRLVAPRPADPAPAAARPAPKPARPARTGPSPWALVRADAARAYASAAKKLRDWLRADDHALIAATAFIALLLIVIVATL